MTTKRTREILEPFLLGKPYPNGDYDAMCPLHEATGRHKRSARINFEKNVWNCFAACGGGNLAGLLARMRERGLPVRAKRKVRSGKPSASMSPDQVDRWHRSLMADEEAKDFLWRIRGVNEETMIRFQLGYDRASQAFIIPITNADGSLFRVRKYRPNAPSDRKIWWHPRLEGARAPLFPEETLMDSEWVVLCEGEMDAILADQYGFPAISGTAGAGTWHVEWSEEFKGKKVFICYDRDTTGDKGAKMVAEHLEPFADSIWIVKNPLVKQGADVTDFFLYPHTAADFKRVLRKGKLYQKRVTDPIDMEPVQVNVMDTYDSQNIGRAQGMDVLILGRTRDTYALPKVVTSTCTMDAGPKCKFCPMLRNKGEHTFEVSPSSPALLSMMGSSTQSQDEALRKQIRAVKCDRLNHEVKSFQTIEQLYVRPSWDETTEGDFTPRRVNSVGKHNTMPSQVVHVVGTTWPDPKEQRNEFLAWEVAESENAIDEFRVNPETVRTLRQFRPWGEQSPLGKLGDLATDLEQHVTRIYGRLDLHVAVNLVFHSIIAFPFQGKLERRGWLDALVVGDTRTGKSEVAQRLLEHYRTGQFVNCEAATFAGVIGGLQQMADRQWAVTWGVVPMSDRRLVVLDEASGLTHEEIQKMSDVRSRGIIKMAKIQADQAWARTRLLWLSNPRDESMERYTYGIQAIPPLIGNREDIARFDFAMALTSSDVEMSEIYRHPSRREPRFTSEDCYTLVMWAWSRQAENVEWEKGAERDVLRAAEWLGEQYVSDPPLLQAANAHVKVARLSVAVAASLFSSDTTGRHLIVRRDHVHAATRFLHHLYSRETFGYHRMSERSRAQKKRANRSMDMAKQYLLENRMLIEFLQGVEGQFRRDLVEQMVNVSREEANAIVNRLFAWGLVSPNGYAVKMNPALHSLLREIEEEV